jgi:hypothetical protein
MFTHALLKTGCALAACGAALAGPLDKTRIGSEAKWIVHIDVESLRHSALGGYLIDEMVKPMLEGREELRDANLSINLTNISSITAYGPAFDKGAEGVLIVSTTADVKKDLDSVAGMFLLSAGTNTPFLLVEKDPLPLYSFSKSVYFAPGDHTLFVAKSREQIERAHRVLQGKEENLTRGGGFKSFKEPPNSFFSVAVAEGFTGELGMPAQAQILKETSGGRLCLGERDKNVFVNLVFQGRDDMATTRIQQVLQGIVALVSLSQQDKEITQLAGATRIASEGNNVLVNLEYPVDKTIEKIKEGQQEKHQEHRPHKAKAKNKNKSKNKAPKAEPQPGEQEQPPSAEIEEKAKESR